MDSEELVTEDDELEDDDELLDSLLELLTLEENEEEVVGLQLTSVIAISRIGTHSFFIVSPFYKRTFSIRLAMI